MPSATHRLRYIAVAVLLTGLALLLLTRPAHGDRGAMPFELRASASLTPPVAACDVRLAEHGG